MTSSISDLGTQLSRQFLLKLLRTDLSTVERRIATGKVSSNMAGMGTQGASNAISYRNKIALNAAYTENLQAARIQFEVMDRAMLSINDLARDTLTSLRKQLQDTDPQAAILSNEAQSKLNSILSNMNTQVNGRYVFAGDNIYTPPHQDVAALNTSFAALTAGWLAGAPTAASVVTDAQGIAGVGLGYDADLLTAGSVSFRGDTNMDIDYTTFANQPGFSDILRGLGIIANLPAPTTPAEQDNYWAVVNGAIALLDQGTKEVDEYQGMLGVQAKVVDDLITTHRENTSIYEEFVGSVEDADLADASIRLQALQSQLEASYNVVAQLKSLSLVNYL